MNYRRIELLDAEGMPFSAVELKVPDASALADIAVYRGRCFALDAHCPGDNAFARYRESVALRCDDLTDDPCEECGGTGRSVPCGDEEPSACPCGVWPYVRIEQLEAELEKANCAVSVENVRSLELVEKCLQLEIKVAELTAELEAERTVARAAITDLTAEQSYIQRLRGELLTSQEQYGRKCDELEAVRKTNGKIHDCTYRQAKIIADLTDERDSAIRARDILDEERTSTGIKAVGLAAKNHALREEREQIKSVVWTLNNALTTYHDFTSELLEAQRLASQIPGLYATDDEPPPPPEVMVEAKFDPEAGRRFVREFAAANPIVSVSDRVPSL